ncbi:MAG: TlyA family RNA methyltransferase [Rhizobiaceae bacterium]|nr:TlyA family RNA methyltransferase [Rhizobiaceae bacterium]
MNAKPAGAAARLRLDELLVRRGHFATRSRARDAVERGAVSLEGAVARKAGQPVAENALLEVADAAAGYVSRAALKLVAALDHFGFDTTGAVALDVGASTGGFTQVLLERGASRVFAVDVGRGQLHPSLAADPRVTAIEGLNARELTAGDLGGIRPDLVVADVSFISLKLALPPALGLAAPGARAVLLVKPQFEAGRDAIGKGGLLRDPSDGPRVAEDIRAWLDALPGWLALGVIASPIAGGDGNREFLLGGVKNR